MNSITIKVDEKTIEKMKTFYADDLKENKNPYAIFTAKADGCTITAYTSKEVLFQGTKASEEVSIWQVIKNKSSEEKIETSIKIEADEISFDEFETKERTSYFTPSIGSDEVGTGDYFGPVIVCATYLSEDNVEFIKALRIDDSKKLTDAIILDVAPKLFERLPYSLLVVGNEKYNEVMKGDMNLNKVKALLHKQAISNLLTKIDGSIHTEIILDQFCSVKNFISYTKDETFAKKVSFYTKAESQFASVACASMMARYIFLKEMDKLSEKIGEEILKGASSKVDELGKRLVQIHGKGILRSIAKLHFKNTEKILSNS